MSGRYNIKFSLPAMSLRQFIEGYEDMFPLVMMVEDGYLGCDEHMHACANGEVYIVHSIKRQPRVILRDCLHRHLAVPKTDSHRMQIVARNGTVGEAMPLKSIMERPDFRELQLMFEQDRAISWMIGSSSLGVGEHLGTLDVFDVFDEKYLVAFFVREPETVGDTLTRMDAPVPIPAYMEITVRVAEGPLQGTHKVFEERVATIAPPSHVNMEKVDTNLEIMMLPSDIQGEGAYEYIKPTDWLKAAAGYRGTTQNEPRYTPLPSTGSVHHTGSPHHSASSRHTGSPHHHSAALPHHTGSPHHSASSHHMGSPHHTSSPRIGASPRYTGSPHRTGSQQPPGSPQHVTTKGQLIRGPQRRPLPPTPDSGEEKQSVGTRDTEKGPGTGASGGGEGGSKEEPKKHFTDISDVPQDVSALTACEVAECLELLKINPAKAQTLIDLQVDGELLLKLSKSSLQKDLNFTELDSVKLMAFAKDGWRPK